MNIEELRMMLATHDIDHSRWGIIGDSKPITSLLEEIEKHETTLMFQGKEVVREVPVVYVVVTYDTLLLVEDRAEWKNGRPPRRRPARGSIAEKRSLEEDPKLAAMRGVKEELGLAISPSRFVLTFGNNRITPSTSYPGLIDHFAEIYYSLSLREEEFNPEGYKEEQADKITYFVWK